MSDFLIDKYFFKFNKKKDIESRGQILNSTQDGYYFEVLFYSFSDGSPLWKQVKHINYFCDCAIFDNERQRNDWFERVGKHIVNC